MGTSVQSPIAKPDSNRFQKIELISHLNEPLELQVLPEGDVLFIERTGALKLFKAAINKVKVLANLPVFHDLEDGLLGLVIDPDFPSNRFIYLFYSPLGEKEEQRVSRFYLGPDALDLKSEKILLEIPTQRKECCHSAGSLAFGPDKNLYIAVGDNTNPHNAGYYNSIDERPGRAFWDAQRTAGNTNDLRGKILRIKPEPDGSVSIPVGNLFPVNTPNTRPEIYAMGARNPYRITVDSLTGWLYWGDVGQNTINNPARGPVSYDEFHQAKKPGFFGWPYFAGDNQPYADFDFATDQIGPFFNPQKPENNSPNNTGLATLPPAESAFIWYSYDESQNFKNLGTGGKSPIAGPFFHSQFYQQQPVWVKTPRKFPEYYNGKWFIAEWMRDWINVVTLDETGKLVDIERFMPSAKFDHPIDLEFGPDGALYVLEYGTGWFAHNQNARLSRIDYVAGNRPPVAKINASKTAGAVPLTVAFSAAESFDYDKNDKLTYAWQLVNPEEKLATEPETNYQFKQPGLYTIRLTVTDDHGLSATQDLKIETGNERPAVNIAFGGNETFYWNQKAKTYQVQVQDREDGSLATGKIAPQAVLVTVNLADMGTDLTLLAQDQEKQATLYLHPGQQLIKQSDCLGCHQEKTKSIGPSWQQVASRYPENEKTIETLTQKIRQGGNGNWGEAAMSAHPQLKAPEIFQMVKYILNLKKEPTANNQLPVKGTFVPDSKAEGLYVFRAVYQDKGFNAAPAQVGQTTHVLRNALVKAISCEELSGVTRYNNSYIRFPAQKSFISFQNMDLTGIASLKVAFDATFPCTLSVRLDQPDGVEIGSLKLQPAAKPAENKNITATISTWTEQELKLKPLSGKHHLYLVATDIQAGATGSNYLSLNTIYFLPPRGNSL
ncbi:PQQ-dependent sugar dehydrogenase [Adhaeribacter pallidiroseus]|uniref:PQQ-dependent sugar dehydrogenase n=1 Tax=Adhaeribacter pallidiroseus TaxID=2072847 RepID=UPI001314F636|nr:PQQ-dependent sugar dehydrogenase [Adhaeribacter pallidiroseus]